MADPATSTGDRLEARLRAEGLDPGPWGNGPGDRYAPHEHGYDKVIVVTSGSITFGLPGSGASIVLSAGDRLELPAGTEHDGLVGPSGVRCLEAHVARGTFSVPRRIPAGEW
jgi:uncharacterized protein YjlB